MDNKQFFHHKENRRTTFLIYSFLIALSISSCSEQVSIIDKGIYEDLTAAEVVTLTETIPSFQFFYDNIRAKIIAKSDISDKEQYKGVTYKRMYEMFNYWGSSEYSDLIECERKQYSDNMALYQVQIDSVSEHFRALVDSVKVKGAPQFDFARIFKHPELCYIATSPRGFPQGQTNVSFKLPIKNQGIFRESGITSLIFKITLIEKGKPNGPSISLGERFQMKLYGNDWNWLDPNKHYYSPPHWEGLYLENYPIFMNYYNPQETPAENFNNVFDWYYEVESVGVKYETSGVPTAFRAFLAEKIPSAVINYWEAQERDNMSKYIKERNNMIIEYVNHNYSSLSQYLPNKIESVLIDTFPEEYVLYQKVKDVKPHLTEEFESILGRIKLNCSEWIPADLQLPVFHPNGNYVVAAEFNKKIFREESGPEYL